MKNLKLIALVATFLFFWVAASASPPLPNGVYIIRWWNGKVLDAAWAERNNNGGAVVLWDFVGGENQMWQVNYIGNNRYSIICKAGRKSLDAAWAERNNNGGSVVLWEHLNGANQQWILEDKGGKYLIRCAASSSPKVVMPLDAQEDNGIKIVLWASHGGSSQQWTLEKVATGRKVSITVGSGGDDLRKGVAFDLLLRDGGVISNVGWIGSVPNFQKKTGFFNIREVKSTDIKAVRLKFDPSPTNPFETPDNWDFNCLNLTFHFNDGSALQLLSKCGFGSSSRGPLIHRFTNDSRVFDVLVY